MRDHGRHRDEEKQRPGAEQRLRQENLQLKKALVKKTLEVDYLKAACAKVAALSQAGTGSGAMASGKQSGKRATNTTAGPRCPVLGTSGPHSAPVTSDEEPSPGNPCCTSHTSDPFAVLPSLQTVKIQTVSPEGFTLSRCQACHRRPAPQTLHSKRQNPGAVLQVISFI